ncbi:MAG: SUF system Fe-S cluster assembly regulator [Xanthomonadales bacterium]|nr:HTH-type transcriptional regulator IscR [Xanthomonadales bacterium]MCC6593984.1 SUF system Fe-S cluster assembly regulator [Xanthomonadales bacterium]MCE7930633.1 SUF system Fe-S cluster assembly regulator [Xanthomonadales bacterium PRO6]
MFRLSKLADYATVLMACLAEEPARQLSAQALAERTRLEGPTVSKLLKQLAQVGLVSSTRGATGGYRLARTAGAISIADIVVAIEGPLGMTECSIHSGLCQRESYCTVSNNLRKISAAVEGALRAITLADMAAPPRQWQPRVSVERVASNGRLPEASGHEQH